MPILSNLVLPWAFPKVESQAEPDAAYLIVVQPALVARDIALTIADYAPCARIITAQTLLAAVRAVNPVRSIAAAFLSMDPEHAETFALCDAVRKRGGRVILIGDTAERRAQEMARAWSVLIRPFSTEAVIASLAEAATWQGAA